MSIVKWGLQDEYGSADKDGLRAETRIFGARTDSVNDRTRALREYRECPRMFQPHPDVPFVYVVNVQPRRVAKSKFHWTVTVEYSSDVGKEKDQNPNPLMRPAIITGDYTDIQRPVFRDRKGRLIATTAGEPIRGITVEESDLILNCQKNIPAVLPNWCFTYNNAINADAVRIAQLGRTARKGTLKTKGIRWSDVQFENRVAFRVINFQLHFRRTGWDREHLNAGFYEKVRIQRTGKTELQRIKIAGEYPTDPIPLDRTGKRPRYFSGEIIRDLQPSDLHYLKFELDNWQPFSVLPLK